MLFRYIRWSPPLTITTFLKYTREMTWKKLLLKVNSIWRLNIPIFLRHVDRWLGFQFCPYVDRWLLEKNLRRISRNASEAFPFRRWSAPLTDHSFFEIHEEWLGLFWNTWGMAWDPLFNSQLVPLFLSKVCVVCLYRVAFHGKEPRCFIVRISSNMPRRLVLDILLYLKWKCFLYVTLCLWVCPYVLLEWMLFKCEFDQEY